MSNTEIDMTLFNLTQDSFTAECKKQKTLYCTDAKETLIEVLVRQLINQEFIRTLVDINFFSIPRELNIFRC